MDHNFISTVYVVLGPPSLHILLYIGHWYKWAIQFITWGSFMPAKSRSFRFLNKGNV